MATAAICLALWGKTSAQRTVSMAGSLALIGVASWLFLQVLGGGIQTLQAGGWAAPFGITLVADILSASLVLLASITAFLCLFAARGTLALDKEALGFHPLYHVLLMGVCGAFLTGDLFNLFVWFEVLLISSFVLLALGTSREQLEGALKYVALNLLASVVFLVGLGLLYGMFGTLNIADLGRKVQDFSDPGLLLAVSMLFLVSFGMKAGVFPLFFWLPASYHTPTPAVSALFAGLLTKVGVYALLRVYSVVFVGGSHEVMLIVAGATMLVGSICAVGQNNVRRMLSFLLIAHVGGMVFGVGMGSSRSLGATVLYVWHHIPAMTALFLLAGVARQAADSDDMGKQGGLARRSPLLAAAFLAAAFSLGGIPPFSGFYGKLGLIQAGLIQGHPWLVALNLATSFFTLLALVRWWNMAFQRPAPGQSLPWSKRAMVGAVAAVGVTLMVAAGSGVLASLASQAGSELALPEGYIRAVLPEEL